MQTISLGDNLHLMSLPYFLGKIRKIFQNVSIFTQHAEHYDILHKVNQVYPY